MKKAALVIQEICISASRISAVGFLYNVMRQSEQMRNSWRGFVVQEEEEKKSAAAAPPSPGEIRSEGSLIFQR